MVPFDWQCPYCGRHSAITAERLQIWTEGLVIPNADGSQTFVCRAIVCPNALCRKITLTFARTKFGGWSDGEARVGEVLDRWRLLPRSSARVLPDYVPRPIVEDYEEACDIAERSPKASATLARRALQGMIRDFWGIKKSKLIDEIEALEEKVDAITWKAIDAVRQLGNIGAHMEKDINLIIEVDDGEAEALLRLVETLVDDWYVARHDREERLKRVIEAADSKKAAKAKLPSAAEKGA